VGWTPVCVELQGRCFQNGAQNTSRCQKSPLISGWWRHGRWRLYYGCYIYLLYMWVKKYPFSKTFFAIFSFRLSIYPRNFAILLPAYIHIYLPILVPYSAILVLKSLHFTNVSQSVSQKVYTRCVKRKETTRYVPLSQSNIPPTEDE